MLENKLNNSIIKTIFHRIKTFLKSNDYLVISFEMSFLPKEKVNDN